MSPFFIFTYEGQNISIIYKSFYRVWTESSSIHRRSVNFHYNHDTVFENDWIDYRKIVIVSWEYIDVSRQHVPCFGTRWISLRYRPSTVSEYIISIDHTIDDSVALVVSACIRMTVYERFITSVTSDALRSHTFQKYDYPSRRSRLVWRENTMSILR